MHRHFQGQRESPDEFLKPAAGSAAPPPPAPDALQPRAHSAAVGGGGDGHGDTHIPQRGRPPARPGPARPGPPGRAPRARRAERREGAGRRVAPGRPPPRLPGASRCGGGGTGAGGRGGGEVVLAPLLRGSRPSLPPRAEGEIGMLFATGGRRRGGSASPGEEPERHVMCLLIRVRGAARGRAGGGGARGAARRGGGVPNRAHLFPLQGGAEDGKLARS